MNILFVCIHNPFSTSTGSRQRSLNIIQALATFSSVDCLIFGEDATFSDQSNSSECCRNIFYYQKPTQRPSEGSMKDRIAFKMRGLNPFCYDPYFERNKEIRKHYIAHTADKGYDKIIFRYFDTYVACKPDKSTSIVIDFDDIPWKEMYFKSKDVNISLAERIYSYYRFVIVKCYTIATINRIDSSNFFANKDDCVYKNSTHLLNIPFIKKGVHDIDDQNKKNILFVGVLGYKPNDYGINHFITNIWKSIQMKHPDANLYIVGRGASQELKENSTKYANVRLLGYVEDLSRIYDKCNIAITPIYSGSGTNIKVLEALHMGKVCIATPYSVRGFGSFLQHKKELFIADDDNQYVNILNNVLENKYDLNSIVERGYSVIQKNFSIQKFTSEIKKIFIQS